LPEIVINHQNFIPQVRTQIPENRIMDSTFLTITRCPVCSSENIQSGFQATDHTVSGKSFEICQCLDCSLRFTQSIPSQDLIKEYYRSETYISHTDTSKGFINRLYHLVRKRTLEGKRKLICSKTGIKSGKLLDIGAGAGAFVHHMQQHGWQATGLEPDESARQRAAALYQVQLLPVESIKTLQDNSYDAITLWHVLEHVHDLHGYMETLKRMIKPGGCIFIAVPNYTSYDARVYRGNWAAYDVPRHLYHFSPASMSRLFRLHNLREKSVHPMWYDSFYISLLSEKYKVGGGNTIRGFWTGAVSNMKTLFHKDRSSSLVYVATR
jgi:2-polyprenyl-3-methyl-5-hydroxy-6-metoxy-1,4-benzoquinol methylase